MLWHDLTITSGGGMNSRFTLALCTTALLGFATPVVALGGTDPVTQLNTDVAQLGTDVTSAHDTLIADLAKVTTDAGKGDRTSAKADLQQFRTDRVSAAVTLTADRATVAADIQAVRTAKLGTKEIAASLKSARSANKAELQEVRDAAQQARAAVKALAGAGKTSSSG
jgi:hypothetical protein